MATGVEFCIEFLSEDEEQHELCHLYWQTNEDGTFTYRVSDLATRYDCKNRDVVARVKKHCRAYRSDWRYQSCGRPLAYVISRCDMQLGKGRTSVPELCSDCQQKASQQDHEKQAQAAHEARREKLKAMRAAYKARAYTQLRPMEFNLLLALATEDDTESARRSVGLTREEANTIKNRLHKLHLVNLGLGIEGYELLDELKKTIKERGPQCFVRSVFGSLDTQELYYKLKAQHDGVLQVQVPFPAFIAREDVAYLLTEDWQEACFLESRAQVLVCDAQGKPEQVYEYAGSHDLRISQREAEFRRVLLHEVGLPLIEVARRQLADW